MLVSVVVTRWLVCVRMNQVFVIDSNPFDPRVVLTAGYDGLVCLWDVDTGARTFEHRLQRPLQRRYSSYPGSSATFLYSLQSIRRSPIVVATRIVSVHL